MTKKMKLMRKALSGVGLFMALTLHAQNEQPLYKDMNAPIHDRVMDLLSRMTVEEKVSLMIHNAPGIPRLEIDKYYHGNEALHGIVRPGKFTVFPQAIGMAASWNPELIYKISTAISDEENGMR